METNYAGIDYGMGRVNIDTETGIRYGVISQHSVGQAWDEEAEPDYGKPTCPKCGNDAEELPAHTEADPNGKWVSVVIDVPDEMADWEELDCCTDYACRDCKCLFGGESAYGDEPLGYSIDNGEYTAVDCLDTDIMLIKSPYYTRAQFCSPCCPGAGSLDTPCAGGPKTYCFGHSWFDDGKAPYPVYSVATGELVEP